jgi:hypothetical protein
MGTRVCWLCADRPQRTSRRAWGDDACGSPRSRQGRGVAGTPARSAALRTPLRHGAALHVPDPRPVREALIAATALVHGLTVVTRHVTDFAPVLAWRRSLRALCPG